MIPLKKGKVITNSQMLNPRDKYTQMIYFMLVDRFNNGNKGNDLPIDDKEVHEKQTTLRRLEGIIQKIEEGYFSELGANTVWLSPITQNPYYAELSTQLHMKVLRLPWIPAYFMYFYRHSIWHKSRIKNIS